jgi:hypothetical protein
VLSDGEKARLQMLQETAKLELLHLQQTNQRLFAQPWSQEEMANKMLDIDFAERVDAFVARFGRLQDLLGDKYLPCLVARSTRTGRHCPRKPRPRRKTRLGSKRRRLDIRQKTA